jgi:uncharacterized membrane protein
MQTESAALPIEFGSLIKRSWAFFKDDWVFYVVGVFLIAMLSQAVFGILVGPLTVGYLACTFKKFRGEQAGIGDMFNLGFASFVPSLVVTLVVGFGVFFGLILLIIPGFILAFFTAFSYHFIADDKLDGIEAIKASCRLVNDNKGAAFGGMFIAGCIGSLGVFLCYFGVFVTGPLAWIMMSMLFQELRGRRIEHPNVA